LKIYRLDKAPASIIIQFHHSETGTLSVTLRITDMTILFANREHTLHAGQVLSGSAGHACTLKVEHGQIWLTIEGQQEDHWLSASDAIAIEPGRLVVVEAQADSRLSLAAGSRAGARQVPHPLEARPTDAARIAPTEVRCREIF
jgi:hypothetical protein